MDSEFNLGVLTMRVLIETLWNVKEEHKKRVRKQAIVLIETLWNVKSIHVDCCCYSIGY